MGKTQDLEQNTKLEEQKKLAGMSYEEMLENFRGKEAE